MPVFSFPRPGMPGGSWTIEEEESTIRYPAPQSSSLGEESSQHSPAPIREPYTVNSEIVLLDPANLSEEVRLLISPTSSASRDTWRVRMSPEYDIEVLPPEQQQDRSETMPRHLRDSPDRRRSRFLHNIFPEIKDDPHPASQQSTAPIPEPYNVNSEIVLLDPANLSEEVRLLASPTSSASRDTWRVRVSPEYDIEVLPPEQQQDRSETVPRHLRDSPERRRSRFLHNIFPEITNDLYFASRGSTDNRSVSPLLDTEWDFPQRDGNAAAPSDASTTNEGNDASLHGTLVLDMEWDFPPYDGNAAAPSDASATGGGNDASLHGIPMLDTERDFPQCDGNAAAPSDGSTTGEGNDASLHGIPMLDTERDPPQCDGNAAAPADASTTRKGNDASLHGIPHPRSMSTLDPGLGTDFPHSSSVEDPARAETESTASNSPLPEEESSFDDDRTTIHSSHSAAVTSISIPSTARPSPSPPRSNVSSPPSSNFGDSDDDSDGDDGDSPQLQQIADDQLMQTPSIQADTAVVADQHDTESPTSTFIRPATASILSDGGSDDLKSKSEAQGEGSDDAELEYLDEPEAPTMMMTPLRLSGLEEMSLSLSLDSSFGMPSGWGVVPHPSSQPGVLFWQPVAQLTDQQPPTSASGHDLAAAAPEEQSIFEPGVKLGKSTDLGEDAASIACDESGGPSNSVSEPAAAPRGLGENTTNIAGDGNGSSSDGVSGPVAEPQSTDQGNGTADIVSNDDSRSSAVVPEPPQISVSTSLEDGAAADASDENDGAASTDGQSDDERLQPSPELPARAEMQLPPIHFPSLSLTEEVLSSPEFHALTFRDDFEVVQQSNSRRRRYTAPGSHVRAFSTPIQRRSILWAPHDTRHPDYDTVTTLRRTGSMGKGKGRERVRTMSGDSGFTESTIDSQRVRREVQTETETAAEHWIQIAKWFSIWDAPADIE
ncbi:hypothetical protein B0H14DRAFT_224511 [Mycena olivaceomarginata]|nr:hypothetical protein B0H14DRAFT_224511 [Mycena olivaceomarginata]